jgi:DNA polymerase-3 subunit alpha
MHGAAEFYMECKKQEIKSILGVQAYLSPRSRFDKEPMDAKSFEVVLLAKNNTGYENLLCLMTEAHMNGFFHHPRIDWDLLQKHSKGLICLSGGLQGEIPQSIINGNTKEKTEEIIKRYQKVFGDDFYLELQRHPNEPNLDTAEKAIVEFGKEKNIPLVATNNSHYISPEDAEAHDILLCAKNNAQKKDPGRFTMLGGDYSLRSSEEMCKLFHDLPEACENTVKIAEMCDVKLTFGEYLLPSFPVPEGETIESYLLKMCEEGVEKRYGFDPKHPKNETEEKIVERMKYELEIINSMGFPAYFLIVADFVQWAKKHNILVGPGRGSAAGSLVSYVLTITNIDPLRYDLLFERFLNPERVSMPDIDIDFPDDRREEVLLYVRKKYGEDRVAQICTFGTMAARASVKDVGRVLGLGFTDMNNFAKLIPERPGITLQEAHEDAADLRKALEENPLFQEIWNIATKIEGTVRHVSVHACAVVISPDPLTKHTALQRAPKDENTIITQYSAKPIEKLGLLKMDFLGLKNLTILVRTMEVIESLHGEKIDLDTIDLESKNAFKLLAAGQSTGVFQLESAGMKRYLKQLKPTNLEDIIAMVSLYRPGPMEWIPNYIEGKHGKKKVEYVHESLAEILEKTFGIAIYQEQILQIAQVFAGFTLGQADILRRAIGKKIASELASQREKFIEGAKEKGHSEKLAIKIFDEVIEPFAGYGFNKSHAAGYAMIAYQTAYLKANYPTAFMTALLASDRDNTDRVIIDIEECRELKIEVLPPNVNESNANFTAIDDKTIRFGLGAIKGVGDSVVESIVREREQGSAFSSFADFIVRCPNKAINKKSLEALAKAGALSGLAEPNEVIENIKVITDFAKSAEKSEADESQNSLFGDEMDSENHELILPEKEPASDAQRLAWERETLGLFVSDHPLKKAKELFSNGGTLVSKLKLKKGKKVRVGGIVLGFRKIITKTKKQMAILQLEDPTGKVEIAVFPKTYEEQSEALRQAEEHGLDHVVLWVRGKADNRQGEMQVIADEIKWEPMTEIEKKVSGKHEIRKGNAVGTDPSVCPEKNKCPGDETHPWKIQLKDGFKPSDLKRLHNVLLAHPGKCPVEIHALGQVFYPQIGVSADDALQKKVREFTG